MKGLIAFLLICPFFGTGQNADSAWIVQNYIKKEQNITMRDGKHLFTAIYMPKDKSEKHPILIMRTPYSCYPYGSDKFRPFWGSHNREYLKENYIMVLQDVRGKYMSEGEFVDVRPFNPDKKDKDIDEASDTYDTVDWLVKNLEGNNGNVGVYGISYPGFYATEAAVSNHPAIKAVSPQAPVTDWFVGDDFHHNGAFMIMDAFEFYVTRGFGSPRPKPTTAVYNKGFIPGTKDKYGFFLKNGPLPNFTKLTGDTIAFWNELMRHPDMDKWWKMRNARVALYKVKPAMLVVGGLYDAEDCFGAWNVFKAIEKQSPETKNSIVMGPWSHGQWSEPEATRLGNIQFGSNTAEWFASNMEVPFFNYYLKGKGKVDGIKNANIFFSGENVWKQFDQWPAEGVKNKPLYLQNGGELKWNKPTGANKFTQYTSDPEKPVPYAEGVLGHRTVEYMTDDQRFASRRPDVIVFKTDTLSEDVTLGGPVTADLNVSITGTDADFVVKLVDVFPDNFQYSDSDNYIMNGYEMLVRGEIFRGRYRHGYEKGVAFLPGKLTKVKFTLPDVAHVFRKGHRIMVQIQSSWFPLADRNPQTFVDIYNAKENDFKKADIRVYHDAARPSCVALPVME